MGSVAVVYVQKFRNGIYRRDAVLETDSTVKYQLADIPLPDGILRVDKVTVQNRRRFVWDIIPCLVWIPI